MAKVYIYDNEFPVCQNLGYNWTQSCGVEHLHMDDRAILYAFPSIPESNIF